VRTPTKASTCTQDQASPNCRIPQPNNKQDKDRNPVISRQASHRHPKTYQLKQHCPLEGKKKPYLHPPGTQAQVPPHTKLTQIPRTISSTEGRNQKEEGIQHYSLRKGDHKQRKN